MKYIRRITVKKEVIISIESFKTLKFKRMFNS